MTTLEPPAKDTRASLRWAVYTLLIVTASGGMIGRILSVRSDKGGTPFLSANDRSRWCTVRAVVDYGTFAIDEVIIRDVRDGREIRDPEWHTIDKVRHKDRQGRWRYYSSKPPLLPTLLAGEYWTIRQLTGATLVDRPFYVARMMLILTNVVPLALAFVLIALLVERFGRSDFGRVFIVAVAAYGTLMTTFAVTVNNHVPAAVSVVIAIYAALRIWYDGDRRWWLFVLAGFFGAFAATNELPALALVAVLGLALLVKAPLRTVLCFVPAIAAATVPFFWINHAVHESWRPPYAHWRDGRELAHTQEPVFARLNAGSLPGVLREELAQAKIALPEEVEIEPRQPKTAKGERWRWVLIDPEHDDRYSIVQVDETTRVHAWDNWYDFPDSYWVGGERTGVDAGEPSRLFYLTHVLIGHYGIFSLTPVWILALGGAIALVVNRQRELHLFGIAVLLISIVVVAFYVMRPEVQRNYGGVTCGLRWLMWLYPLWLTVMIPAVDWIGGGERDRSLWWTLALVLLLVSAITAAYAGSNPWTYPWIYQYWEYLGWPVSSRAMLPPL